MLFSKKKKNKKNVHKKGSLRHIFGAFVAVGLLSATPALAQERRWSGLQDEAIYAVGEDGRVFLDQGSDSEVVPASTVKLMTLYMLMESIERGELSLDDEIVMSRRADNVPDGYRQTNLVAGQRFTVDYALRAMFVYSANDIASATGARISEVRTGQWAELSFVELMNAKAVELGMENTEFFDASGMSGSARTTPEDMSILARAFVSRFPELFDNDDSFIDYPSEPNFRVWGGNRNNTNGLLRDCPCDFQIPETEFEYVFDDPLNSFGGDPSNRSEIIRSVSLPEEAFSFEVDGLKTGFTLKAGFSIVSTAVSKHPETGEPYRIFVTYFGGSSANSRNETVLNVFNDAFAQHYRDEAILSARAQDEEALRQQIYRENGLSYVEDDFHYPFNLDTDYAPYNRDYRSRNYMFRTPGH
ncbi:MAG: hypothetical protein CMP22_06910 [Rickettsiales bacterium]|nr:hypothetical protein [Rickettsiales bacterium]